MSTTEVIPHAPSAPPPAAMSREEVDLLKDLYFKGASDLEFKFFLHLCNAKNLSPLNKQIHPVLRWDSTLKKNVMSYQIAIDGFRLIADRTSKYEGQDGPYWCGSDGKWVDVWLDRQHPPVAAKVGVYKKGFLKPLYAVALYAEYVQLTREGEVNSIWRKRPAGQLAKCAESLALRMAFPEELSGLYTGDEMGQADNPPTGTAPAPSPTAPAITAPVQTEDPTVPDPVLMMWSKMKTIKDVCEVFADLKNWMKELGGADGEKEYYRILKEYGSAEHANQLKQRGAKVCARKLWEAVQKAEMLRPEPEPGTTGEEKPGELHE